MTKETDFVPRDGAYNINKFPAMFELKIPYQVKSGVYTHVNIEDVGRSFDHHFGHQSTKKLKEFTEALMNQITPEQVEKALEKVVSSGP